ncbi:hypothetical protein [Bacillus xiapuensis]|nr:hypothetical protein [Bacillus xiapuensis]
MIHECLAAKKVSPEQLLQVEMVVENKMAQMEKGANQDEYGK